MRVSCSVVLYNTTKEDFTNVLFSLEGEIMISKIFIVDNSPTKLIYIDHFITKSKKIEYYHTPSNPGFGASHNLAITKSIQENFEFHFIVNPDVIFDKGVTNSMLSFINKDSSIGLMMPQILNHDGTIQNLPKLLPSLFSIFMRKLKRPKRVYEKFINKYEFRSGDKDKIYNLPVLSGCFTLLRIKVIEELGMYDDRYFMYFEDWDLSRRIHKKYKTLYYPNVSVYHGYESGANKSFNLFKIYLKSLIIYFNKWGWLIDKDRRKINQKALNQL